MKKVAFCLLTLALGAAPAFAGGYGYGAQAFAPVRQVVPVAAPPVLAAPGCYAEPGLAPAPVYEAPLLAAPAYAAPALVVRQRAFVPAYGVGVGVRASFGVRSFSSFRANRGFGFGGGRGAVIRQRSVIRVR